MGMLLYIVMGGALGWAASVAMPTDKTGVFWNVASGMAGALLGSWMLAPMLGAESMSPSGFGLGGLMEAAIGAVIAIALTLLVRKLVTRHQ